MGALTFKPQAYQSRPWELVQLEVPDFIDDQQNLTFFFRGQSLVKISSRDWLRDRIRFSYDGFRRQRLTYPMYENQFINWPTAITVWFDLVYQRQLNLVVDQVQPYSFYLVLLLQRLSFISSRACQTYAVDVNIQAQIYHGSYGLRSCQLAQLVIPAAQPYEELEVVTNLSTVKTFQSWVLTFCQLIFNHHHQQSLFVDQRQLKTFLFSPFIRGSLMFKSRIACFQVSPLQKFLTG